MVATNGDRVELTVVAGGTAPLTYQWRFQATNELPGATAATLVLDPVRAADAGSYAVVIGNAVATVTSRSAQVTVLLPPEIVSAPADTAATNGGPAHFEVTAAGTAPLTYQWVFQATNELPGATAATLDLAAVTPAAAGAYQVRVANPVATLTSAPASLTVLLLSLIHISEPTRPY